MQADSPIGQLAAAAGARISYTQQHEPPSLRGAVMYQAYLLLQPNTDFTLEAAQQKLLAKFPKLVPARAGEELTFTGADWEFYLRVNAGPDVLADSEKFAEEIAGDGGEEGRQIAAIDRRVEIGSDMADPEMDHFEDYLTLLDTLRSFRGIIAIDPSEPSLL
jgi:hypothetical protein